MKCMHANWLFQLCAQFKWLRLKGTVKMGQKIKTPLIFHGVVHT